MARALLAAFRDEILEKRAGVLGLVARHPFTALQVGGIGAGAVSSGYEGFRRGMSGERPRYLQASKYGPSESFSTNFHEVLPHEADAGERRRMSFHYNRKAFGDA